MWEAAIQRDSLGLVGVSVSKIQSSTTPTAPAPGGWPFRYLQISFCTKDRDKWTEQWKKWCHKLMIWQSYLSLNELRIFEASQQRIGVFPPAGGLPSRLSKSPKPIRGLKLDGQKHWQKHWPTWSVLFRIGWFQPPRMSNIIQYIHQYPRFPQNFTTLWHEIMK